MRPAQAGGGRLDGEHLASGVTSSLGFLGVRETRKYMHADFFMPGLAFRGGLEDWMASGSQDLLAVAVARARDFAARPPVGPPGAVARELSAAVVANALRVGISDAPDPVALRESALEARENDD
jgi:hypothetical protein